MPEIVSTFTKYCPKVSTTVLKQMSQVIYGMLISNGRITMLEFPAGRKAVGLPNDPTLVSQSTDLAANHVDFVHEPVVEARS